MVAFEKFTISCKDLKARWDYKMHRKLCITEQFSVYDVGDSKFLMIIQVAKKSMQTVSYIISEQII